MLSSSGTNLIALLHITAIAPLVLGYISDTHQLTVPAVQHATRPHHPHIAQRVADLSDLLPELIQEGQPLLGD